jgi:hypothetical protein
MTTFQDRERAEEAKFAHDEEMAFRIHARRNRLLGTWAAERMGLLPAEAESYAKAVVQADFEEAGDEDVVRKILGDLISAGVEADEAEVRLAMKAKEAEPAARCWAPTDPFPTGASPDAHACRPDRGADPRRHSRCRGDHHRSCRRWRPLRRACGVASFAGRPRIAQHKAVFAALGGRMGANCTPCNSPPPRPPDPLRRRPD